MSDKLIEDIHKFLDTGNAAQAIEIERSARELLQDALPILESNRQAVRELVEELVEAKRILTVLGVHMDKRVLAEIIRYRSRLDALIAKHPKEER